MLLHCVNVLESDSYCYCSVRVALAKTVTATVTTPGVKSFKCVHTTPAQCRLNILLVCCLHPQRTHDRVLLSALSACIAEQNNSGRDGR